MKSEKAKIVSMIFFLFSLSEILYSQKIHLGADVVSKYIWRGLEINKAPNIQPYAELNVSGFNFGIWGSYEFGSHNKKNIYSHELNGYVAYNHFTEAGRFSIQIKDCYYPSAGIEINNFNSDGSGAHTVESSVSYEGPLSILFAYNIYNDAGNNLYFEISYSVKIVGTSLDIFVGATPGSEVNPSYYESENFAIINLGLTANKTFKLSEKFELPVFTSFVLNPKKEKAYIILGISL